MDAELLALARSCVEQNRQSGRWITTAESCTGGLVAAAITEIPGASEMLDRAFITYSNQAKIELLDVPADVLRAHGAVSEPTARAMALGALARSGADVAVAVSGIAGPDGGSEEKPVGTVVFACATRTKGDPLVTAETRRFGNPGRHEIRRQAVLAALRLLLP